MEENKDHHSMDDERKSSIKLTMGCLLVIFVVITSIVIGLIAMYLRSIFTGSKEFMIN